MLPSLLMGGLKYDHAAQEILFVEAQQLLVHFCTYPNRSNVPISNYLA